MTIAAAIAFFIYLILRDPSREWLSDLSDKIDEEMEKDPEKCAIFKKNVFTTLNKTKHPLGEDGFEQLV